MMQESVKFGDTNLVTLIDVPEWKTILLDLVSSEKMDPWNIDIVDLSEKYLKKINSMEQTDLRVPANAILASAILLRAKSKLLKIPSLEEEETKNGMDHRFGLHPDYHHYFGLRPSSQRQSSGYSYPFDYQFWHGLGPLAKQ